MTAEKRTPKDSESSQSSRQPRCRTRQLHVVGQTDSQFSLAPIQYSRCTRRLASASDLVAASPPFAVIAPPQPGSPAGTEMPAVRDASIVESSEKSMEQKAVDEGLLSCSQ